MVLGSSKTYSFLGTEMRYNKMQMLSDREHRWKCFIPTAPGEGRAQGTRLLGPGGEPQSNHCSLWDVTGDSGAGLFIILSLGPRWSSWQPGLWLGVQLKAGNCNKRELGRGTGLDLNMSQVLLSLHLQSALHWAHNNSWVLIHLLCFIRHGPFPSSTCTEQKVLLGDFCST